MHAVYLVPVSDQQCLAERRETRLQPRKVINLQKLFLVNKFLVITVFMRGDGRPANYVLSRANYRLFSLTAVKSIQARKRRAKGKAVKRPPPLHDKAKTLEKRSVGAK